MYNVQKEKKQEWSVNIYFSKASKLDTTHKTIISSIFCYELLDPKDVLSSRCSEHSFMFWEYKGYNKDREINQMCE